METNIISVNITRIIREKVNFTVPSSLEDCKALRRLVWDVRHALHNIPEDESKKRIGEFTWRTPQYSIIVQATHYIKSESWILSIGSLYRVMDYTLHQTFKEVYFQLSEYECALNEAIFTLGNIE